MNNLKMLIKIHFYLLQRRSTTSGMFWDWVTIIILLLVTISVNTSILDEIVAALNNEIPDVARYAPPR